MGPSAGGLARDRSHRSPGRSSGAGPSRPAQPQPAVEGTPWHPLAAARTATQAGALSDGRRGGGAAGDGRRATLPGASGRRPTQRATPACDAPAEWQNAFGSHAIHWNSEAKLWSHPTALNYRICFLLRCSDRQAHACTAHVLCSFVERRISALDVSCLSWKRVTEQRNSRSNIAQGLAPRSTGPVQADLSPSCQPASMPVSWPVLCPVAIWCFVLDHIARAVR